MANAVSFNAHRMAFGASSHDRLVAEENAPVCGYAALRWGVVEHKSAVQLHGDGLCVRLIMSDPARWAVPRTLQGLTIVMPMLIGTRRMCRFESDPDLDIPIDACQSRGCCTLACNMWCVHTAFMSALVAVQYALTAQCLQSRRARVIASHRGDHASLPVWAVLQLIDDCNVLLRYLIALSTGHGGVCAVLDSPG